MQFRKVRKTGDSYTVTIPPAFLRVLGIKPTDTVIMMLLTENILAIAAHENLNDLLSYSEGKKNLQTSKQVVVETRAHTADSSNNTPAKPIIEGENAE